MAKSKIEVTYSLNNSEFNKSLSKMRDEVTTLNKEFNLQKEEMRLTSSESEKLSAQMDKLKKEYQIQEKVVEETNAGYQNAVELLGENSKEAEIWNRKLIDSQTKLQKLENTITTTNTAYEKSVREMSGFGKKLEDIQKESVALEDDLKDIEKALKMDPGNVDLIDQKYANLEKQISLTTDEVDELRIQQGKLKDVDTAGYEKLTREIAKSEGKLRELTGEMGDLDSEVKEVGDSAGETGGTIGEWDGAFKAVLAGGAIASIAEGLGAVAAKAQEILQDALEMQKTDTIIKYSMDLDDAGVDKVNAAIRGVEKYGIDSQEALGGVRRQFQLNEDAAEGANEEIVRMAGVVATMWEEVDFDELIQESFEVSKALKISQEDALGLMNHLLKMGFPPGEIDIIAEYGKQLEMAGYNAEEIQAIFAAGVDTGTWNIDNLMDGLKEGRIKLAEFAGELTPVMEGLISKTDLSAEQFQILATEVAKGGENGKKAYAEIARQVGNMTDKTAQAELGVQLYGTKWEDQGTDIIDTILSIDDHMKPLVETQSALNAAADGMDETALVKYNEAMARLDASTIPAKTALAEFVAGGIELVDESVEESIDWLEKYNNFMLGISDSAREGTDSIVQLMDGTYAAIDSMGNSLGLVTESVFVEWQGAQREALQNQRVYYSDAQAASSQYSQHISDDSNIRSAALTGEAEAAGYAFETTVSKMTEAEKAVATIMEEQGLEWDKAQEKMYGYQEQTGLTASEISRYAADMGESIDGFVSLHNALLDDAEEALESYTGAASSGWEKINQNETIGWEEYLKNMEANRKAQENWWENLKILNEAGVDAAIIQELQEMGPAAAKQTQRLVDELYKGSDKQGVAYDDMDKKTKEKVDGINETRRKSIESGAQIADEAINEADWPGKGEREMDELAESIALNEFKVREATESAVKQGAQGYENQRPALFEAAEKLGLTTGDGIELGIETRRPDVDAASRDLAKSSLNIMDDNFSDAESVIDRHMANATADVKREKKEMTRALNSMDWRIPKPKVPKFDITGSLDITKGSVPKINMWYAKGGYTDKTSLIGIGEAGAEGIVPLQGQHMYPFADAVAERIENNTTNATTINISATINNDMDVEALGRTIDRHLNTQAHEVSIVKGR